MVKEKDVASASPLDDKNIATFVDNLLAEKNYKDIEPEVMQQLREDLADRVEEIINATILANMPSENLEAFEKLVKSGSREEVAKFCEAKIPNLQQVVADALVEFRKTYLVI